jgi:two-component system chemotaxis response regulator CheB
VLVQDPADAAYPAMPSNVLKHVKVDFTAPARELAAIIDKLARVVRPSVPSPGSSMADAEIALAAMRAPSEVEIDPPGIASGFSCPDCGGGLFEIRDGELVRYRCRVGHAWSPESLLGEQSDQLESALWMALRTLDEKAALSRQLAERAGERGSLHTAQRFGAQADDAARAATLIRRMLENPPAQVTPAI